MKPIGQPWHLFVLATVLLHLCVPSAIAQPVQLETKALAVRVIEQLCVECHNSETSAGGLDLQRLPRNLSDGDVLGRWVRIHDRIANHEMPPDADRLPDTQRVPLLAQLSEALHAADHGQVRAEGRGPMRRLNRGEYEENLRDLLQLPHLDIRDMLPEDSEAYDSNKSSQMLDITRVQLNAYLDAADVALRQAVASGTAPRDAVRYHAWATNMFPKAIDHAGRESTFYAKNSKMIPLTTADLKRIRQQNRHDQDVEVAIFRSATWPYYGYPEEFVASGSGSYHVRFMARAVRQLRDFRLLPSRRPQPMTFRARQPSLADVSGDVRATGGVIDVQPESQVYETEVQLEQGETIEYSLLGLPVPFPITSHGGPLYYDFPPMPTGGHPGIAFRWIEIVGPVDPEPWPPASHRVLFEDLPIRQAEHGGSPLAIEVVSENPTSDAARLLKRFADAVARRPVQPSELQVYQQLVCDQLEQGRAFADALLTGYKALLCSRHFLFLHEPKDPTDHFAIASRLSHFLWNSRPDPHLIDLARSRQLRDGRTLREETDRLIEDERFQRFVRNFVDYWLELKALRRDAPDIRLYPEYRGDDYLVESMEWETRAFFAAMVRENLSVSTLIQSEFAMVNDRLARHYDLPEVRGSSIRKVQLPPSSPRGGLLTQAAVLKVTANGTTTSPVIRGAWIMDRIMGDPPPPPPPGVPTVEPDLRGAATIREILRAHAAAEECSSCHRRFDPVGLALENFDILGGWRDRYRSLEKGDEITGIDRAGHTYSYRVASAVESSGQLHDGTTFRDISELKTILQSESRQLARNLLQRFVVYATGTPARFSDREEIEGILDECQPSGYRLRDLLHGLVQNRMFLGEAGLTGDRDKLAVSNQMKNSRNP